jgi:iron(III) transport system substrate-binding protein
VLITVDAANLWRATEAGILEPLHSEELDRLVPEDLRDPGGHWYGLALRARTIMRSAERVGPDEVTTYEGLGDPRWKGRLCLRSGTSEYNVSFVADRLAKDGPEATEEMLRAWMENDPDILGSDVDVLEAIADGDCDVGLTNHYYLAREKEEDPDFPVEPVWADQAGRGTHVNLSGMGVVKGSDRAGDARELIEFLVTPEQQQVFSDNNHEFPVSEELEFKADPIDVERAGARLDDALNLMDEVGWD